MYEQFKKLIDESNLDKTQKNVHLGYIRRAEDAFKLKDQWRTILEGVGVKHPYDIAPVNSVIFYSVLESGNTLPIWGVVVYREKEGRWVRLAEMSPSKEGAMLVYIQDRFDIRTLKDLFPVKSPLQ